jgi:hypothetical protein
MNLHRAFRTLTIAVFCVVGVAGEVAAESETGCQAAPATVRQLITASTMTTRLRDHLDASGAAVAIIAQVGSNQSHRGLKYTHGGLAWRDHPKGPWTVVQVLNLCGTGRSGIYEQGLMRFFLDDPLSYDV